MKSIDYLQAQSNLARAMRDVNQSHEPVLIDGLGEHQAVLLSREDYLRLIETIDQRKQRKVARPQQVMLDNKLT